jgi:hypothetical protein
MPFSPDSADICRPDAANDLRPHRPAQAGDEAVMKQNLTAMKPFWRFCANVLKRLMCTGFVNDAPK